MPFFGGGPPSPPGSGLYHYVGTNILGGTGSLNVSTGQDNMGLGTGALENILAGDGVVALGNNAGNAIVSASDSVFIGGDTSTSHNNTALTTSSGIVTIGNNINNILLPTSLSDCILIGNIIDIADGGQNNILIGFNSARITGNNNIAMGLTTSVIGNNSVAIGGGITAGPNCTIIGNSASGNFTSATAIGQGAGAFGDNSIVLGANAGASAHSIVIGKSASDHSFNHSICIGDGSHNTAADQIVIGDSTYTGGVIIGGVPIGGVYFFSGPFGSFPAAGGNVGKLAFADDQDAVYLSDGSEWLLFHTSSVTTISAAGSVQSDATQITTAEVNVTTVTAGQGVILPDFDPGVTVGASIRITNNGAAALTVYPQLGATIDNGAANASFTVPVSETVTLTLMAANTWYTTQDTVKAGSGLAIAPIQGGLRVTLSPVVDYTTPATGFTYTVPDGTTTAIIEPAGTLATGTINMPATPTDGQRLIISCTQQITALTMSGNGKTLNGALVTIGANGFAAWQYRAATTSWYRIG